jgi:hypothetical protein
MTDQYMHTVYGATEKDYPFAMVSDAKFTEVCFPSIHWQR